MNSLKVFALFLSLASVTAAQKEVPLPKDLPPYAAEQPLRAPAVQSSKLANGLTVWLVSQRGLPKVAFAVAVRGGFDPADRPGITELLTKTIDQGTTSRTAKQISQELQAAGGDLSAESSKDFMQVSTAVLSSKVNVGLTILSDILQNASFPDAEVALAKRNLADSLRERESQPSFLAARVMGKVLFGEHPYHVTAPTQESIAASTATDLRNTYALRVRPDDACPVPERREEVTTEGGLDVVRHAPRVRGAVERLAGAGIRVSLFVDPDEAQLRANYAATGDFRPDAQRS